MFPNINDNLLENAPPVPKNEMERLLALSGFDVDYSDQQDNFSDLTKLAAKVAGTSISLINLIDSLTQWTVSNHGMDLDQMLRQDSVCQYTIVNNDCFEVEDLSADDRFKDKFYVAGDPNIKYYYGVPLSVGNGLNIGALCVIDKETRRLDPEKIELLKIIASEIVSRLKTFKVLENLKMKLAESYQLQKKVAHDIRGPLGGIIGLASIIKDQGESNQMEEVLEFINLIHKSGNSILDLADEILSANKATNTNAKNGAAGNAFNLLVFKDKLEKLYEPQAKNKNIRFYVTTTAKTESISFSKNKLLQIAGNLISNSMKFTPYGGEVSVDLNLTVTNFNKTLIITVTDNGIGLTESSKQSILDGTAWSTDGTGGEQGYGFGLALVRHLIESLKGTLEIESEPGRGASFIVQLPQA